MNKAIVMGHLTKDPTVKQTGSGISVCSISIATNEKYKNRDGEMVENPLSTIVFFGVNPQTLRENMPTNETLCLLKIEKRTWDKDDGTKGYATEIVADTFNICKSASPRKDNLTADDVEDVFEEDLPF